MRLMKVFDCQDMPDQLRKVFFHYMSAGNDCYVIFYMEDEDSDASHKEIYDWLMLNGATYNDESVLIKHWW